MVKGKCSIPTMRVVVSCSLFVALAFGGVVSPALSEDAVQEVDASSAAASSSSEVEASSADLVIEESAEQDVVQQDGATSAEQSEAVATYDATEPGVAADDGSATTTEATVSRKKSIAKAKVSAIKARTYTGKAIRPKPTVSLGSTKLVAGTDYTLSYANNTNAGTATITIKGKGAYTGTRKVTFKIVKAANTVVAKAKKEKVSIVRSTTKACTCAANITVAKARGTVTYANTSTNATAKTFKVNKKTGRVTVPKGCKAGTYEVRVRVRAAGDANHKARTRTVTFKVVVKKTLKERYVAKVRSIAKNNTRNGSYHTAYYRIADVYGNSTKELLVGTHEESGSGSTIRIYTFVGNKITLLHKFGVYGDVEYRFYKKTRALILYSGGHGGEVYKYFKLGIGSNGKSTSKEVAYKGRRSEYYGNAYTGPWNYSDGFSAATSGLRSGKAIVLKTYSSTWKKVVV